MSNLIYATSLKGHVAVRFNSYKKDLNASKLWSIVKSIINMKPKKIIITYAATRSALKDNKEIQDPEVKEIIFKILDGCVETESPNISGGKVMDLFLGQCSSYTLPFGTSAMDTGHVSILMPLPFVEEGCYHLHAGFHGNLASRRTGGEDHYVLDVSAELYIKQLNQDEVDYALKRGIKVYPFMIKNPSYLPRDSETSDSEGLTFSSEDEGLGYASAPGAPRKKKQLTPRPKIMKRKKIMRQLFAATKEGAQTILNKLQEEPRTSNTTHTTAAAVHITDRDPGTD
nr:matrix protein [Paris yunnanensis betanucleorhabdovirus 1]